MESVHWSPPAVGLGFHSYKRTLSQAIQARPELRNIYWSNQKPCKDRAERANLSYSREQLAKKNAQRLTTILFKAIWEPVGGGVKPDVEVEWVIQFVLGDEAGAAVAERIDSTIARLLGLGWFDYLSRAREGNLKGSVPTDLHWVTGAVSQ